MQCAGHRKGCSATWKACGSPQLLIRTPDEHETTKRLHLVLSRNRPTHRKSLSKSSPLQQPSSAARFSSFPQFLRQPATVTVGDQLATVRVGGQLATVRVGGQLATVRVGGQLFHIISKSYLPLNEPFCYAFGKKSECWKIPGQSYLYVYGIRQSQHNLKTQNFFAMARRFDASLPRSSCTACGRRTWGVTELGVGNICNVQSWAIEQSLEIVCGTSRESCRGFYGIWASRFSLNAPTHVATVLRSSIWGKITSPSVLSTDPPCFTAIMVAGLSAIMVANSFLSLHKKNKMLNRRKSANLLGTWRSYKERPCEGLYFLPSRVWFFLVIPNSCVFFLVCAWIFHKCTVCIAMCPFATECTRFFNLNIRTTLHTFVLCNLLFWSKSLWIELAWNACILESTTKTVVNTEEWGGDIYGRNGIVNRMFQSMQFLNALFFAAGKCTWMPAKSEYRGTFILWKQETMDSSDWNLFAKN